MCSEASVRRTIEQLLTAEQVAAKLGIDETTVRRHQWSGALPCVRIGRSVRFRESDVVAWQDKLPAKEGK